MRFTLVTVALCVAACGEPPPPSQTRPPPAEPSRAEAVEPRSPAPEPQTDPESEPRLPSRVVIEGLGRLGRHRVPRQRVVDGPWAIDSVQAQPGDQTVSVLGHELEGCRTTELEGGEAVWCPDLGVVSRRGREGGWFIDESVVAARVGDATWAERPCLAMELVDEGVLEGLCERPIRTLGSGPRRTEDAECSWRYTLDGPRPPGGRRADVAVRLASDAEALQEWAGVPSDATAREAGEFRAWIVRGDRWSAAVRVRTSACGETDGRALAERLVELAPD